MLKNWLGAPWWSGLSLTPLLQAACVCQEQVPVHLGSRSSNAYQTYCQTHPASSTCMLAVSGRPAAWVERGKNLRCLVNTLQLLSSKKKIMQGPTTVTTSNDLIGTH